jgi:hypothetical protein
MTGTPCTRRSLVSVLAWPCAILLLCATTSAQSLAEVARAEAARRKAITLPSRAYTNKDLKPVPPAPSPPDGTDDTEPPPPAARSRRDTPGRETSRTARGAEPAKDDVEPDGDQGVDTDAGEERRRGEDEAHWRRRMADALGQMDRNRTFAEALQSRINALSADFSARDDPARRAAIKTQLDKALAELERVRAELEEQEQGVTDLEEEARRAGVPPGWLR